MATTSIGDEIQRGQSVRRVRRADLAADYRRVAGAACAAAADRPLRVAAPCLAPVLVRVFGVYDHAFNNGPLRRVVERLMPQTRSEQARIEPAAVPAALRADPNPRGVATGRRVHLRALPLLLTLAAVAVASELSWAMWETYMGAPWTRDGTVRA